MITTGAREIVMNTGEGDKFIMYLADIETALLNVGEDYYVHRRDNTDESGFTLEFLHQLRTIQEDKKQNDPNSPYHGVIIGYNQDKEEYYYLSLVCDYIEKRQIERVDVCNRSILNRHNNLNKLIKPDFILHTKDNLDRQEYYGEIKMQGNPNALEDLTKISEWKTILEEAYASDVYIENNLDPRYGLYIFVYVYNENELTSTGLPKDNSLNARIKRMENHDLVNTYCRDIICFSLIDGNNRRVLCQTLGEILDTIDN